VIPTRWSSAIEILRRRLRRAEEDRSLLRGAPPWWWDRFHRLAVDRDPPADAGTPPATSADEIAVRERDDAWPWQRS
jgi:hypothetical protein